MAFYVLLICCDVFLLTLIKVFPWGGIFMFFNWPFLQISRKYTPQTFCNICKIRRQEYQRVKACIFDCTQWKQDNDRLKTGLLISPHFLNTFGPQTSRLIANPLRDSNFYPKIVTKLSKMWVWDPWSGFRKKPSPDPGSRIQGSKRHRISDPGSATPLLAWLLQGVCFVLESSPSAAVCK